MSITELRDFYYKEVEPQITQIVGLFVIYFLLWITEYIFFRFIEIELSKFLIILFFLNMPFALIIWLLNKKLNKFKKGELGILIAINKLNKETDQDLHSISERLNSIISDENLGNIKVVTLSKHLIPRKDKDAHRIKNECNAQVIIWGDVENGNISGSNVTKFQPIKFSYRLPLPMNRAAQVGKFINLALQSKDWIIEENDNIVGREYLTKNIKEISYLIIGVILYFNNDKDAALRILDVLLSMMKTKPIKSSNDEYLIEFVNTLIYYMCESYTREIELWPNSKNQINSIQLAEKIKEKCIYFDFKVLPILLDAQIEFSKTRNIPKCISITEEALLISNPDAGVHLTLAFLYFYNSDLEKGWFYLKQAFPQKFSPTFNRGLVSVVRWYEESIAEDSSKTFLYFPLGVLYFELIWDNKLAKESFSMYMDNYGSSTERKYKNFVYLSRKYLKKLEKKTS